MSFVVTKVSLLRQNFCRDKIMFVTTKGLLRQKYVTTSILLSWQKMCFVATNTQQNFCCDKNHAGGSSRQWYLMRSHNKRRVQLCCYWKEWTNLLWQRSQKFCRNKNGTCGSSCQWYNTVPNLTFDFITSHHLPHEHSSEWSTDNEKQHHLSRKTKVTENPCLFFKEKRESKQKLWKTFFF